MHHDRTLGMQQIGQLIFGRPLPRGYQLALMLIRLGELGRKVGGEFVGTEHLAHFELDLALTIDCRPTLDSMIPARAM